MNGATKGRILIVDDEPAILASVSDILDLEGYPVETAANGAEALAAVERSLPAVVLLDMRMPVLDGWGFARALRERRIKVPILVMTAAQNARAWAEEISAEGYVPKPFDMEELLAAIARVSPAA